MNESERLADQIQRAVQGDAWHGPAWHDVLEGVGREAALKKPLPGAHSIAELVLHVTNWHDVVRRRLAGEIPNVTDEQDWPKAAFATEEEWQSAVVKLRESGVALRDAVAVFPPERLAEKRSNVDQTWYMLLAGILQHDIYHAGQAGMLKKAVVPAASGVAGA